MKAHPFTAHLQLLFGYLFAEHDLIDKMLAVVVDQIIAAFADSRSCGGYGLVGALAFAFLF